MTAYLLVEINCLILIPYPTLCTVLISVLRFDHNTIIVQYSLCFIAPLSADHLFKILSSSGATEHDG